jgi:hypothetical protein
MLLPAAAFVVSTYAVSSLMPLTLHILRNGLSLSNAALMAVDLGAAFISIWFLARVIYRIDKRAGRIRNRVGWFE